MSPGTSAEGADVTKARRVKTVNTQPGGKTVGHGSDRYRLRWIVGIGASSIEPNHGRECRPPETSFGTRRSGYIAHGQSIADGLGLICIILWDPFA